METRAALAGQLKLPGAGQRNTSASSAASARAEGLDPGKVTVFDLGTRPEDGTIARLGAGAYGEGDLVRNPEALTAAGGAALSGAAVGGRANAGANAGLPGNADAKGASAERGAAALTDRSFDREDGVGRGEGSAGGVAGAGARAAGAGVQADAARGSDASGAAQGEGGVLATLGRGGVGGAGGVRAVDVGAGGALPGRDWGALGAAAGDGYEDVLPLIVSDMQARTIRLTCNHTCLQGGATCSAPYCIEAFVKLYMQPLQELQLRQSMLAIVGIKHLCVSLSAAAKARQPLGRLTCVPRYCTSTCLFNSPIFSAG